MKDPRFNPFDYDEFEHGTKYADVPLEIRTKVQECLPERIVYRRRDFEAEAMMREMVRRWNFVLPATSTNSELPGEQVKVCVISKGSSAMSNVLNQELYASEQIVLITGEDAPERADKVLLLLEEGVLLPTGTAFAQLLQVLKADREAGTDRIVFVFDPNSWKFGSDEQKSSTQEVQGALNGHEAITFRPKDDEGAQCHEFPAMMQQLLSKLRSSGRDIRMTPRMKQARVDE